MQNATKQTTPTAMSRAKAMLKDFAVATMAAACWSPQHRASVGGDRQVVETVSRLSAQKVTRHANDVCLKRGTAIPCQNSCKAARHIGSGREAAPSARGASKLA